jgi:hypothetical protein
MCHRTRVYVIKQPLLVLQTISVIVYSWMVIEILIQSDYRNRSWCIQGIDLVRQFTGSGKQTFDICPEGLNSGDSITADNWWVFGTEMDGVSEKYVSILRSTRCGIDVPSILMITKVGPLLFVFVWRHMYCWGNYGYNTELIGNIFHSRLVQYFNSMHN